MTKFDGWAEKARDVAERKAAGFQPGEMVEIFDKRRKTRTSRIGMVVSAYKPTGARWITRLEVLVDGELEDVNVSLLKKIRERKTSGV